MSEKTARVMLPFRLTFDLSSTDRPGLPTKKPGRGDAGWTVGEFATIAERDAFMVAHREAAMPCWSRIVTGEP